MIEAPRRCEISLGLFIWPLAGAAFYAAVAWLAWRLI
jgi:hypothetical protein